MTNEDYENDDVLDEESDEDFCEWLYATHPDIYESLTEEYMTALLTEREQE